MSNAAAQPRPAADPDAPRSLPPLTKLDQLRADLRTCAPDDDAANEAVALGTSYAEITAREAANNYLRQLRGVEVDLEVARQEANREVARVQARHEAVTGPLQRRGLWLRGMLEYLFAFMPPRKGKSTALIEGRLGTKQAHREKVVVVDASAALLAWAQVHAPLAVNHVPAVTVEAHDVLDVTTLKHALLDMRERQVLHLAETPQLVDGAEVWPLLEADKDGVALAVPDVLYVKAVDRFYAEPDGI